MARQLVYRDFDVLLEPAGDHNYWARVPHAPAGQTPPVMFTLPVSPLELENFLLKIGRPRRIVRRVDAPETAAAKTFGTKLYQALFRGDLGANLLRSQDAARSSGAGLRIRLCLSGAPALADLPWEFLYDPARNRFLCLSERTPLVRYLEVRDPPRPVYVSPPLQILVMISSPTDYPKLDVEHEWARLRDALAPLEHAGHVRLERLGKATLPRLRQRLRREDWHVLHFVGHGGFDHQAQDGALVLEDQAGRGRLTSGEELGVVLNDHDPLRLVVLNACEGARADPADPFAGIAQTLLQQGIPAVVAMQFEITDQAAIVLAHELYAAVADGYPLDAALTQARKAIYTDVSQVEWATPVLYLRAPDGRIFDVAPVAPPPPARATGPPPRPSGDPRPGQPAISSAQPGQSRPLPPGARPLPPGVRPMVPEGQPSKSGSPTPLGEGSSSPDDAIHGAERRDSTNRRVYEIAKELGVPSKDLQRELSSMGVETKSHSSTVPRDVYRAVLKAHKGPRQTRPEARPGQPRQRRKSRPGSAASDANQDDLWRQFAREYEIGELIWVEVLKIVRYGAFVRVANGINGLVHKSELADRYISSPEDVVSVGDEILVKIISIDPSRRRLSLSLSQALQDEKYEEVERASEDLRSKWEDDAR